VEVHVAKGNNTRQTALTVLAGTVVAVVIVGFLYWAQSIFIPLALAIYLSFLLAPLVSWLQRYHTPRVPAVMAVMLLALVVLGGLAWLITSQVTGVVERLPSYDVNIKAKVKVVVDSVENLKQHLQALLGSFGSSGNEDSVSVKNESIIVRTDSTEWVARLLGMILPVAHGLASGGLALVLTGFMLLKREEMRNRLIHLTSGGRFTVTTKVIDEASQRVSRYLVMQALSNAVAGASIGLGLWIVGLNYAFLWGFLIFLLRYIPYVGIWIAAVPPVLLAFAMFEGWTQPLVIVGLMLVVEIFCANILEPYLFGRSMGVSEIALLVSAAFWAFLWGPIGMVLSSPLTVCLVVLGKYDPRLKFFDVLLGDEPAMERGSRFYQRLLARDADEAEAIALEHVKDTPAATVFDAVLVPALVYAREDRGRDDLSGEEEEFILSATCEIGEDLAERLIRRDSEAAGGSEKPERKRLLACPAHDEMDRAALCLLASILDPDRWNVEVLSKGELVSLLVSPDDTEFDRICIAALPPGGLSHTRYLCKRLRMRFPGVKILVLRSGTDPEAKENLAPLMRAGAAEVASTLLEARARLSEDLKAMDGDKAPELISAGEVAIT
jgi:predicted PurR-regulated permease PerM